MHAARAARLRPAAKPELLEQRLHFHGHATNVVPLHARTRIEIDAQLVGMIEIVGAHRVRMQLDAAEVDDPRQSSGVVDDELLGGAPRGKRQCDGAQPLGPLVRRALLVERLGLGAVDESLEDERPIANAGDRARRDGQIVLHELELRELGLAREVRLVRIGDLDVAPRDRQHFRRLENDHGSFAVPVRGSKVAPAGSTCMRRFVAPSTCDDVGVICAERAS